MPASRILAASVLGLRIAYGAALVAAPERLTRRWLGPAVAHDPAQVALRGLGAREVLLHAGGLAATLRGGAVPATFAVAGASAAISVAVGALLDR